MTARRSLFRIGLYALFVANVVYFVSVHLAAPSPQGHLTNGSPFPALAAKSLEGVSVDWRDRWTLALFFRTSTVGADELARYAGELDRRFHDSGLTVLALVAGSPGEVGRFAQMNRLQFPVVADGGAWERALGLSGHDLGVFLVRPEGEVEFAAMEVRPRDLRLLVESNLLGATGDRVEPGFAPLARGDFLPDVDVRRLGGAKTVRLSDVEADILVFFGPECPVCGLREVAASFAEFERSQRERGKRVAGLFSTRFSEADIRRELGDFPPDTDLYLALSGLPGIEDGYRREAALRAGVVALELDAERRVVSMEALP